MFDKIAKWVELTYTDSDTGKAFLSLVLLLGGFGFLLCIGWFVHMVLEGIPTWALILDIIIFLFCLWAIFFGIVPMYRSAFKELDKMKEDKTE